MTNIKLPQSSNFIEGRIVWYVNICQYSSHMFYISITNLPNSNNVVIQVDITEINQLIETLEQALLNDLNIYGEASLVSAYSLETLKPIINRYRRLQDEEYIKMHKSDEKL